MLDSELVAPNVYVRPMLARESRIEATPMSWDSMLEDVLLKRKKSLSFSLNTRSRRTLVESILLGLDHVPMNSAKPLPRSGAPGVGKGKAFNTC